MKYRHGDNLRLFSMAKWRIVSKKVVSISSIDVN